MANEMAWRGKTTGSTIYFTIRRPADNYMWDTDPDWGPGFKAFAVADWYHANAAAGNYWIALPETPASSYLYIGSWPNQLTDVGFYYVDIYKQAGANPAISDSLVGTIYGYWNGTTFDPSETAIIPTAAQNADAVLDEAKGAHAGLLAGVALDSTVAKETTLSTLAGVSVPAIMTVSAAGDIVIMKTAGGATLATFTKTTPGGVETWTKT